MSIRMRSTSLSSADGEHIILRETATTRLIFQPSIVENQNNNVASVRGKFLYHRKGANSEWIEHNELSLSHLRANEWVSLELKSQELFDFFDHLESYYKIHEMFGIPRGDKQFLEITDDNEKMLELISQDTSLITDFLESDASNESLLSILEWISKSSINPEAIEKLTEMDLDNLDSLDNILGIVKIRKILKTWHENIKNNSEHFWQKLLTENPWIISQIFPNPLTFLADEAYVGGKNINNKDGKIVDFIYKNSISENVTLIEIKTPLTKLIGTEYRNNVYSIHTELSGAITQILSYKDQLQKDYFNLFRESLAPFNYFNPNSVVILGNTDGLNSEQMQSFELFRNDLKNITVITFDELFEKVEMMLNLLTTD